MTKHGGGRPLPTWLDLTDTVSVITGGGTHLGKAMATALAELGSAVQLVGRRRDVVQSAAAELQAGGLDAAAWCLDAADEAAVAVLVDDLLGRRGRIDTVVCCAGGSVGADQVPDVRPADLAATLRKNVETTMVMAQAAARVMIPRRRGAIITIGSIHGSLGSDGRRYAAGYGRSPSSYHAAKGAVINLTRALACDLAAFGITVNCISPGQIPTERMDEDTRERQRDGIPLGRLGRPEDLRGAVTLLASESGRWITGQNIVVDGGWSAW